jgi:hypothetical protein
MGDGAMVVVRVYGVIGPQEWDGHYLQWYDPEGNAGNGDVRITPFREHAARFPDIDAVLRLYRAVQKCRPLRDDGKPNRPLSAFTLDVQQADAAPDNLLDSVMEKMRGVQ